MTREDQEHLKILSILHYVWGGLGFLGGCLMLLYALLIGTVFMSMPATAGRQRPEAAAVGGVMIAIFLGITLLIWALAFCVILAGKYLSERRNSLFCLIVSGFNCLHMPLGTLLGVFTIIVLMRPTVKAAFEGHSSGDVNPFVQGENPYRQY